MANNPIYQSGGESVSQSSEADVLNNPIYEGSGTGLLNPLFP